MEQEMKIITRQETFTDLAVRELGKTRAACFCKVQFKRCGKERCARCPQHINLENCRHSMSDYDRLRLDSYTAEYYAEFSKNPMAWMNHKEYVRHFARFILVFMFFFILILGILGILLAMVM